jgi:branched-subunit amino acid transport protein
LTSTWTAIVVLALATAAIRAFGPLALGGRDLPPRVMAVVALLAPALLAALVITETLGAEEGVTVDARLAGLSAAGVAIAARRPPLVVVLIAAAVTALLRAVS